MAYEPTKDDKFTTGLWCTAFNGREVFGVPVRPPLDPMDNIRGLAVHISARVSALAHAGQILVSSTVKDLTAGSGLNFEDAGQHEMKGVPDQWHLYRVCS